MTGVGMGRKSCRRAAISLTIAGLVIAFAISLLVSLLYKEQETTTLVAVWFEASGGALNHAASSARHVSVASLAAAGVPERTLLRGSHSSNDGTQRVLCITGPIFGRTFNQIIGTAAALKIVTSSEHNVNGTTIVGLSPDYSRFYIEFLDPRDDILIDYEGPCVAAYTPREIFYALEHTMLKNELRQLIPKAVYRAEAEAALAAYTLPVTTVHRRDLEGWCIRRAKNLEFIHCPNGDVTDQLQVSDFVDSCNMEYSMLANATQGPSSVLLLTDGQVPELDATFPLVSNHSFPVQTWIMTLSAVHYGNPLSSIDFLVSYWRGDDADTRPRACYNSAIE